MGWWGKSESPKPEQAPVPAPESQNEKPKNEKPFDPKLPAVEKLPKGLQSIVDKADQDGSFFDGLNEG